MGEQGIEIHVRVVTRRKEKITRETEKRRKRRNQKKQKQGTKERKNKNTRTPCIFETFKRVGNYGNLSFCGDEKNKYLF